LAASLANTHVCTRILRAFDHRRIDGWVRPIAEYVAVALSVAHQKVRRPVVRTTPMRGNVSAGRTGALATARDQIPAPLPPGIPAETGSTVLRSVAPSRFA
jgi:hypothetical protein